LAPRGIGLSVDAIDRHAITIAGSVSDELVLAVAATRLLGAMFVDVTPGDPLTLAAVTLVLLIVALAAAYLPARRASSVDPVRTIRSE
jgi:ABC-type lipoprotein release transport system permease subunit